MTLEEDQFKLIFPHAPQDCFLPLQKGMEKYGIVEESDINNFLATLVHESNGLTIWMENLNYSVDGLLKTFGKYFPTRELAQKYARTPEKIANKVYANKGGNGSEFSGDGWRYRGRGPIQITEKSNYESISKGIGQDLVLNPDLLATNHEIGIEASCYWYKVNVLKR